MGELPRNRARAAGLEGDGRTPGPPPGNAPNLEKVSCHEWTLDAAPDRVRLWSDDRVCGSGGCPPSSISRPGLRAADGVPAGPRLRVPGERDGPILFLPVQQDAR